MSNKEIIKPIPEFNDYFVSNLGHVYSSKYGYLRKLKPYADGKGRYLQVNLAHNSGTRKKVLVHRLVAIAFIPNPQNCPEVNHIDKNPKNNCRENLEWCTRKENLYDSYTTMSPVRNFRKCYLYKKNSLIGEFESIVSASKYAAVELGASKSSLEKYLKYDDIYICVQGSDRTARPRIASRRYSPIIIKDGLTTIFQCKTVQDAVRFFNKELNINISCRIIENCYKTSKKCFGYTIIRELR